MYWFANEDSFISQNQLNLHEVKDIVVKNPEKPTFMLMAKKDGKVSEYKLKCESVEERELWVHSIQMEIKHNSTSKEKSLIKPKKFEEKSTLIIDYDLVMNPDLQEDEFSEERRNLH